ncbi:hypothetical protein ACOME3_000936 [Neoechinorhynchus agilis]
MILIKFGFNLWIFQINMLTRCIGYQFVRCRLIPFKRLSITPFSVVRFLSTPSHPPPPAQLDEEVEKRRKAERDARMVKLSGLMIGTWIVGAFTYALVEWGSPDKDDFGQEMIKDPTSDKLLPDPVNYPLYQPPYTLVVEHSGVLVHPEWSYKNGWRYKKRPGLEYFISKVGYPVFELVIYTSDSSITAAPILHGIDAEGNKLFAALFRENTRYRNGTHIKDLSCLNRELSKVIIVDWDEKAYQLQPRNGIHRIPKWNGNDDDRFLVNLADFLEMLANSNVNDIRDVLDHYNKELNPVEAFVQKQQQLLEKMQAKPDKSDLKIR